ncbi:helix-turn-helix domain-containing protein, partial [Verrucomicrobiales bacterium]|nr:helix-turn-helix domain-containing protein [Verrucomicrobiales bacterium]
LPVFLQAGRELAFYKGTAATDSPAAIEPEDLNLENMEKRMIDVALGQTGGNRTEAAKLLGISRRTLQRKLKED